MSRDRPDSIEWSLQRIANHLGNISAASFDLARIERKIDALQRTENQEVADLTQLTQDVAANGDAISSAVQLLVTLHDEIVAAGTDPAALASLAESLEANTEALSNAIVANTPAAPSP